MTYFPNLHTYLHQSSLLLQAYPHTTRITTKYSLPRKAVSKGSKSTDASNGAQAPNRQTREPSATLILKTYHPDSGICLKYRTDKAAEVGRLMTGLGRLARGEVVEMPTGGDADTITGSGVVIGSGEGLSTGGPAQGDKMDVDGQGTSSAQPKTATQMTQQGNAGQQGGGKKKKKGKK